MIPWTSLHANRSVHDDARRRARHKNKMPKFIVNNAAMFASGSTIDASRLSTAVTLMFRVYFSVLWLVSNVSKFIFSNTTDNNTFINNINVKNTNIYK